MYDPRWGPVTEDLLTRDFTLVQRAKGHRFSSDDMATAFVAVRAAPHAERVLDLGCGIGSVLLHLAWSLPRASLVGVEAQAQSFALLQENVRRNALAERVAVHRGDLRTHALEGRFELVTGTPPYFPPGTAVDARDEQRTFARIELRGGIEAYVLAAASVLAEQGTLVLCGAAGTEQRLRSAAAQTGLHVVARCPIVARAPAPPLFVVWTLRRHHEPCAQSSLVLRDDEGKSTVDAALLKAFSGLGPRVLRFANLSPRG